MMGTNFSEALFKLYENSSQQTILTLLHNQKPPQCFTYRTLLDKAGQYAHLLADAGIPPGDVVIIILQHGEELVYAFWGCVLRGAIPSIMPFLTEKLSPEHYRQALTSLFSITGPQAVITYTEFLKEVQAAVQPSSSVRVILDAKDARVFPIGETSPFDKGGLGRDPEDIVLLQHSSGTTGLQKGVALTHAAVFNQLESYSTALHLREGDSIFSWLPLYHDMGLIAGFILPILCGTPLILMSPFDWVRAPEKMMKAISNLRVTLAWLPNFAYNFCAQKIQDRDLEGIDLSSWRSVINCSEPVYESSHRLFFERFRPYGFKESALATCYAMAENVFAVTQGGIDSPLTVDEISQDAFLHHHEACVAKPGEPFLHMVSCGQPIAGVSIQILDDNNRNPLQERHVGEIALSSSFLLREYYNRPDATAEAFHDGWYLTGDYGYLADGELYVTGRKKDLIIVAGKNIYSRDLENIASEVKGVHGGRVAAFGIYSEASGTEEVVIVCEVDTANPQEKDRIAEDVRLAIAQGTDVIVRNVHVVPRGWLLKTSSGKVSRSSNRDKYLAEISKEANTINTPTIIID